MMMFGKTSMIVLDSRKGRRMIVSTLLAGLNRKLDEVRGRIMGWKPLPPIREVFDEVRREESRRRVMLRHPDPNPSL